MNRIIKKKPVDGTPLTFAKMGAKPVKQQTADIENAADAKKPGDAAEDVKAAGQQKGSNQGSKKVIKKKGGNANFFAKKAATALAAKA